MIPIDGPNSFGAPTPFCNYVALMFTALGVNYVNSLVRSCVSFSFNVLLNN